MMIYGSAPPTEFEKDLQMSIDQLSKTQFYLMKAVSKVDDPLDSQVQKINKIQVKILKLQEKIKKI